MRSILLLSCFCFLMIGLKAQQPALNEVTRKGASPSSSNQTKETGVIRAVIVGISNYQNAKITDLEFADKDAKAYASYLLSKDGPALDSANVTLLLNEKATSGQFVSALYSLMEESKEGDLAIIYFSGHGDVESKTLNQPGFLLCWDAPSRVYMGGGTFGLSYFQEIISTMSAGSKAKVLVITDACRSGTLAGSSIGGTQATASNLAKQYANEVKIMSCQADEFSLEGKAWGGGRGVFSYYLLAGIQGLADRNNDEIVTLAEIERYLGDKVPAAAAPHSQIPMTVGNKNSPISRVNPEVLAKLQKTDLESGFSTTGQKSMDSGISGLTDSALIRKVAAFNKALAAGRLVEPKNNNAWTIFQELKNVPELGKYLGLMKRNLAAALQDEAQQAINDYLVADPKELKDRWNFNPKYEKYPDYLQKAAELLGESHFFYKTLLARLHYFRGLNFRLKAEREQSDSLLQLAISEQEKGLLLEPKSAHMFNELGWISYLQKKPSKSIEYYQKALVYAPNWALLLSNMCASHNENNQFNEAISAGNQAIKCDSLFPLAYNNLGISCYWQKDYDQSKRNLEFAISLDSSYSDAYFALSEVNKALKNYDKSIQYRQRGLQFDSTNIEQINSLGNLYLLSNKLSQAKQQFEKAKSIKPITEYSYQGMIEYYFYTKDLTKAEQELQSYLEQYPKDNYAYYLLASIAIQTSRPSDSRNHLEQAFKLGFKDLELIQKDENFKAFVEGAEYKKLVQQYFSK